MKDFFTWFVTFILTLLGFVLLAAFEGWIFSLLWNWLVPLFWTSAPILTIWQGFGILLLINLIFRRHSSDNK